MLFRGLTACLSIVLLITCVSPGIAQKRGAPQADTVDTDSERQTAADRSSVTNDRSVSSKAQASDVKQKTKSQARGNNTSNANPQDTKTLPPAKKKSIFRLDEPSKQYDEWSDYTNRLDKLHLQRSPLNPESGVDYMLRDFF
jgi:hypothetical protein